MQDQEVVFVDGVCSLFSGCGALELDGSMVGLGCGRFVGMEGINRGEEEGVGFREGAGGHAGEGSLDGEGGHVCGGDRCFPFGRGNGQAGRYGELAVGTFLGAAASASWGTYGRVRAALAWAAVVGCLPAGFDE